MSKLTITDERRQMMDLVRVNAHRLSESDRTFGLNLLRSIDKWGLSPKMLVCLERLADRADSAYIAPATSKAPEQVRASVSTNILRVKQLIESAKANGLKYPKLHLHVGDANRTGEIRLTVAGARSRTPGEIFITDGGPFGSNEYYGRVSDEGVWTQSGSARKIEQFVFELANDPEGALQRHGHTTGHCACCNRKLTDEPSLRAGVGPVCAKKFGLDWGRMNTPRKVRALALA